MGEEIEYQTMNVSLCAYGIVHHLFSLLVHLNGVIPLLPAPWQSCRGEKSSSFLSSSSFFSYLPRICISSLTTIYFAKLIIQTLLVSLSRALSMGETVYLSSFGSLERQLNFYLLGGIT